MRRKVVLATLTALALALLPVAAFADTTPPPTTADIASDTVWVIVTGVFVLFMQAPFAGFIYPLISHQLFGGGWMQATLGAQDFAGSTVVHLTGATAGFAGLLLLGPRIGKYERRRKPNAIPGHSMPIAQLGVLILWF